MKKNFTNVSDVKQWRLCVGCGACAFICPDDNIRLENIPESGIRPLVREDDCTGCASCLQVCSGIDSSKSLPQDSSTKYWGTILECWEGFSTDPEIRFQGSSGGLLSSLALYALEKENMDGILHVAGDRDIPWLNKTVFSQNRKEILNNAGSRYAPSSPCEKLDWIENAPTPCVFIGKPCDVAALGKSQAFRPTLEDKTGLILSFFCAGVPSTSGTLDLLNQNGLDPEKVSKIRYRGNGWPGNFIAQSKRDSFLPLALSYNDSWGFLQSYRPFRCHLCPDGTGEFADISCGDAWYRRGEENGEGFSLVVVRTERGRDFLHLAADAGYISLNPVEKIAVHLSQEYLIRKRQAMWGRLFAMNSMGIPTPKYRGFPLLKNWYELPVGYKVKSILGTYRRIIKRKLFMREKP